VTGSLCFSVSVCVYCFVFLTVKYFGRPRPWKCAIQINVTLTLTLKAGEMAALSSQE